MAGTKPYSTPKSRVNKTIHAKPDLRVEFEPNDHFFRLGDFRRYSLNEKMNQALWNLITATGCKPKRGAPDSSVDDAFRRFGLLASKPVRELFSTANGGNVRRINSRFFSLSEAIEIWETSYSELEWRVFPFFTDMEHESDPVVISLDGPLLGHACQARHGGDWRVLAPDLKSFLRATRKIKDNKRFFVENHGFVYPRNLSAADVFTAKGLIDLSYTSRAQWMERSTFVELALSMVHDEDLLEILRLEAHPDSNSRFLIRQRLNSRSDPAAKRAAAKICSQ